MKILPMSNSNQGTWLAAAAAGIQSRHLVNLMRMQYAQTGSTLTVSNRVTLTCNLLDPKSIPDEAA